MRTPNVRRLSWAFVLSATTLWASPGCSPENEQCTTTTGCADGETCGPDGTCIPATTDDAGPSDAGPVTGGDAGVDGGPTGPTDPIRPPNPNNPNNQVLDSDCDGISDGEEFTAYYPGNERTDPADYDTDGDGIADGIEIGRTEAIDSECPETWVDADASSKTNPTSADTDADCIPDGLEDANKNGRVDPGETDPTDPDSDRDGIPDGTEDANCNGLKDTGETGAATADSDSDGINDRIERDVTGTDPLNPDSDNDGIPDGNEDLNQNGVVDPGETNPNQPDMDSDGDGISDAKETALGYDPMNPDMDGDGLCDGPQDVAGTCTGGEDQNGDGIIDAGESNPRSPDTDCDGVADGEEVTAGTNPRVSDSDGDLVPDGVEMGKTGPVAGASCGTVAVDADPSTTTNPTVGDTDGDGINDGIEDRNRDGALAPSNPGGVQETDPGSADTDSDGLCDGPIAAAGCTAGEDRNRNGQKDQGETDPRVPNVDSDMDGLDDDQEINVTGTNPNQADTDMDGLNDGDELGRLTNPLSPDSDCDGVSDGEEVNTTMTDPLAFDSDGDGLGDGLELGKTANLDPTNCTGIFVPDADPSTTTDPRRGDSDGDGVGDGAEDGNQNGAVDPGELNPNFGGDVSGGGPVASACAQPITPVLHNQQLSDLLVATSPAFASANAAPVLVGGVEVGLTVSNAANNIVAFAIKKAPEGANEGAELTAIRNRIGNVSVPLEQPFTTWDGFGAMRGVYNFGGGGGFAGRVTQAVRQAAGNGSAVVNVASMPSAGGPYKLGLNVVRRSATSSVVVGVIVPASAYDANDAFFEDFANGSALGQAADSVGQQCDRFESVPDQPVDIIWVIDDSGSMSDEQAAVAAAASAMGTQLSGSTLDWRIAIVTTYYHSRQAVGDTIFDFTNNIATFQSNVNAVVASGRGSERGFQSLERAMDNRWLPAAPNNAARIRPDARVVIVVLSDAGDQSSVQNTSYWTNYFQGGAHADSWDPNRTDEAPMVMGGILCPLGTGSGCTGEGDSTSGAAPGPLLQYHNTITNLGGIVGAIAESDGSQLNNTSQIGSIIEAILNAAIGNAAPYVLDKAPISATIKVALEGPTRGACDLTNVPRSRENGFAYDGTTGGLAFFGNCRPANENTDIAVSYFYWLDLTSDPDGGDLPCNGECEDPFVCVNDQCLCPADCGTGGALPDNQTCNPATCEPECLADCGGCPAGKVCATDTCGCVCPDNCNATPRPSADHTCNDSCEWECTGAGCDDECPADCGQDLAPGEICDQSTCTVRCAADCNATCSGFETCNTDTCACECTASTSCADGFVFDTDACMCVCDAVALGCAATHEADLDSCSCTCGRSQGEGGAVDCNNACSGGTLCQASTCTCQPFEG